MASDLEERLRSVGARRARLRAQLDPVERETADAIRQAAAEGLTRRRIAELVGLSFQRVQQIVKEGPG